MWKLVRTVARRGLICHWQAPTGFNDRMETCNARDRRRVNDKISPDCQTLHGQIILNGHNADSDGTCGLASDEHAQLTIRGDPIQPA